MKGQKMNSDLENMRGSILELEAENKKLQAKLLLAMSQNYCTICGNILDGYVPPKEKE